MFHQEAAYCADKVQLPEDMSKGKPVTTGVVEPWPALSAPLEPTVICSNGPQHEQAAPSQGA